MGMIRRTLLALVLLGVAVPTGGTLWLILFYSDPPLPPDAAAIVVLSSGLTEDGDLGLHTAARVDRAIDLFHAGAAPLIVMSGGQLPRQPRDMAGAMVAVALAEGVPRAALIGEARSQSTLQNALYTREALGAAAGRPLILVTHKYHLARAWASFRWAGMDRLTLVAADPDSRPAPGELLRSLGWEALKWTINILRGTGARVAWSLGVPPDRTEPLLR